MLTITARHTIVGFHRWPDAPAHRDYLRDRHRHEFRVAATVLVDHDDRDTEFHDLAGVVAEGLYRLAETRSGGPAAVALQFGAQSCEMLAEGLAEFLAQQGYKPFTVVVSEDGQHDGTWWSAPFATLLQAHLKQVRA